MKTVKLCMIMLISLLAVNSFAKTYRHSIPYHSECYAQCSCGPNYHFYDPNQNSLGQLGLGIVVDERTDTMEPIFFFVNNGLTAGFGASYARIKHSGTLKTMTIVGHFGFRNMICNWNQLFFTGGIGGTYGIANKFKNPYIVGPFIGFDYQPCHNIMVTAQIMPYSYERNSANFKENEFFQEGLLGLVYFFN